jgi:hypothetical protein
MANKYTFKTLVAELIKFAKLNIADLAKKELSNKEKKAQLDKAILGYLVPLLSTAKFGFFTKFVLERFVIDNIPVITQAIYDLIKSKVEGVTNDN